LRLCLTLFVIWFAQPPIWGREIVLTSQDFTLFAMDFAFKVNLTAVVRVRAADESVARKVVPTVLGAPGTVELGLANENNFATGQDARVLDVGFSIGSVTPVNRGANSLMNMKKTTAPTPTARSGRK
jgi:hypothetical protein